MGMSRDAKLFGDKRVAEVAAKIEHEHGSKFTPFGAELKVTPIKISHVKTAGEGVRLDLDPHDIGGWEHWGFFESDVEYRARPRFSRRWQDMKTPEEVKLWLEQQVAIYLETLEERSQMLRAKRSN